MDHLSVLHAPAGDLIDLIGKDLHLIEQGGQAVVQPVHGGVAIGHFGVGLELPRDAAHVLAAPHLSGVGALENAPGLKAHDAAHVIAQVLVPDLAAVGAALDGAPGQSGNTTHAGGDLLVGIGVQRPGVDAPVQRAEILAGNAAHIGHTGDLDLAGGAFDAAGLSIDSHQAAHVLLAGDGPFGGAGADGAVIFAGKQAQLAGGALGLQQALHAQSLHHGALRQGAEQTQGGALVVIGDAADGVAVAVEGPLKNGDGLKIRAAQIQIGGDPLRPDVPGAVLDQGIKLFGAGDGDAVALGRNRGSQGEERCSCQNQCRSPFIQFHGGPPSRCQAGPAADTCSRSVRPRCRGARP